MNPGPGTYTDILTTLNQVGGTITFVCIFCYICCILIFLGVSDPKNLMPMYKKLHSAIREVDDRHVILFEPTIIITSVSITYTCTFVCTM